MLGVPYPPRARGRGFAHVDAAVRLPKGWGTGHSAELRFGS